MSAGAFAEELAASTAALEKAGAERVRWFRAPGGHLTPMMARVCQQQGLHHALGDVYCNDFAVTDTDYVARTMLRQATDGSVCIMHMPELGFREHGLESLSKLLDGLEARGMRCVTLSKLAELAESPSAEQNSVPVVAT